LVPDTLQLLRARASITRNSYVNSVLVSVCLSVCLSVTSRYRCKTRWGRLRVFTIRQLRVSTVVCCDKILRRWV